MNYYEELGISPKVIKFCEEIEAELKERFENIDRIAEQNQAKVLIAMQKNRVNAGCFAGSSGYGYNDAGRDTLERVYADTFHTEAALVRPQLVCGTHALAVALSANLLPSAERMRLRSRFRQIFCRVTSCFHPSASRTIRWKR